MRQLHLGCPEFLGNRVRINVQSQRQQPLQREAQKEQLIVRCGHLQRVQRRVSPQDRPFQRVGITRTSFTTLRLLSRGYNPTLHRIDAA
jgi:DNA-binding response OmpR family regulator